MCKYIFGIIFPWLETSETARMSAAMYLPVVTLLVPCFARRTHACSG